MTEVRNGKRLAVRLGGVPVTLRSQDEQVTAQWATLFARQAVAEGEDDGPAAIQLLLRITKELPPLPPQMPHFSHRPFPVAAPEQELAAYRLAQGHILLKLPDGTQIHLPRLSLERQAEGEVATVAMTREALALGHLEDVTMATLAPLLRVWHVYAVHAFGAALAEEGVLLVGGSGSGKTTTGLNLVSSGWRFLANDVVLLREEEGCVYAFPSPGHVSVAPDSLALLPQLAPLLAGLTLHPGHGKYHLPATALEGQERPVPVKLICFPEVVAQRSSQIVAMKRAVALARLMADSVDNWDQTALADHMALLHRLSRQARSVALRLAGDDVSQIPTLLEEALLG